MFLWLWMSGAETSISCFMSSIVKICENAASFATIATCIDILGPKVQSLKYCNHVWLFQSMIALQTVWSCSARCDPAHWEFSGVILRILTLIMFFKELGWIWWSPLRGYQTTLMITLKCMIPGNRPFTQSLLQHKSFPPWSTLQQEHVSTDTLTNKMHWVTETVTCCSTWMVLWVPLMPLESDWTNDTLLPLPVHELQHDVWVILFNTTEYIV